MGEKTARLLTTKRHGYEKKGRMRLPFIQRIFRSRRSREAELMKTAEREKDPRKIMKSRIPRNGKVLAEIMARR